MAHDAPDELVAFAESEGIEFPLLMDKDSAVIREYGILNEEQGTIAHPTTVIVDREGTVRWVRVDEDYRKRPSPSEVLAALDELGDGSS